MAAVLTDGLPRKYADGQVIFRLGTFVAHCDLLPGDLARIGRERVKLPDSRGSLQQICEYGAVLPKSAFGSIFQNRGIPTFLLGDYLSGHRIAQNSHVPRGSLAANRMIRRVLPQERPFWWRQGNQIKPSRLNACARSVPRRCLCRHRGSAAPRDCPKSCRTCPVRR